MENTEVIQRLHEIELLLLESISKLEQARAEAKVMRIRLGEKK